MRKVFARLGWIPALLLLLAPVAQATSAPVAEGGPVLERLVVPAAVRAGEPFALEMQVRQALDGPRDAVAVLRSPSGQEVTVRFTARTGAPLLQAWAALSDWAEAGAWRIDRLVLSDNAGRSTLLEHGRGLNSAITVMAEGPPDLFAPLVRRVTLEPERAEQGGQIEVTVSAADDLSGVGQVRAWLEPVSGAGEEVPVHLHWQPELRRWAGRVPAPLLTGTLRLDRVEAIDVAGNRARWIAPEGTGYRVTVEPAHLSASYRPDPELGVLVDRPLYFAAWQAADQQRMEDRLQGLRQPGMRAQLTAELKELATVAGSLRAEMIADPDRGMAVAGPATAGKAFAVASAIKARLLLLLELDRQTGGRPGLGVLSVADLRQAYVVEEHGGAIPVPRDTLVRSGPAFTAQVVRTLRAAATGGALFTAPHLDRRWSEPDFLPDHALWVTPYTYPDAFAEHRELGGLDVVVAMDPWLLQDPTMLAETVVHELGHHVHDALFGRFDPENIWWNRYLTLRDALPASAVGPAHDGRPEENFAEDFAFLYGPPDMLAQYVDRQASAAQSFPLLADHPEMAAGLQRLLTTALAGPRLPALVLTAPAAEFTLPDEPELTVTGHWAPGHEVEVYWTEAHPAELLGGDYSFTMEARARLLVGPDGQFTARLSDLPRGVPLQVVVEGLGPTGERAQVKVLMVLVQPA